MRARGPAPALADNSVLRAWWVAGAWAKLAPMVEQLAHVVALRTVRAEDVAADVAQDAVIRCWRATTVPDAPTAFVQRVARNLALDYLKRGSHRHEVAADTVPEAEGLALNPLDAIVLREARERLRLTLRMVPEHLRKPLILHVFHQRSVRQLSDQFNTTEGAMKMRLTRARAALRAVYDEDTAAPTRADLTLTTHAKRLQTMEVRAFVPMETHEHRIGTWNLPAHKWALLRDVLIKGALAAGVVLHIDDTHAVRHGTATQAPLRPTVD